MANMNWARSETKTLMACHGLTNKGWQFGWNNRKTANGICDYSRKVIYLSKALTPLRKEKDVTNTIIHEIAHALVGYDHGHDWYWKEQFVAMGGDGQRCSSDNTGIRQDKATYLMIDHNNDVIKYYLRKPNKKVTNNIKHYWVNGRKAETIGKLRIIKRVA
jgi:hypothetical protein